MLRARIRFVYSEFALVGPAMNLAARLMCAPCNTGVLVDEETYNACASHFAFTAMPPIKVKNIATLLPVFTPAAGDPTDDADDEKKVRGSAV